jgi:hypothetical protein
MEKRHFSIGALSVMVILCLLCSDINAQRVSKYEYWFDNNIASRTNRTVTGTSGLTTIADSINISGLQTGLHFLSFRFGTTARWSAVTTQLFYKSAATSNGTTISEMEYWFDDNRNARITQAINGKSPNGLVMDSVNIQALGNGLHRFNVRLGTSNGWTSVTTHLFYKLNPTNTTVNTIEYWVDNDVANLKSKNIAFNTEGVAIDSLDIRTLTNGLHRLNLRLGTANGGSSLTSHLFYKFNSDTVGVSAIEYWMNGDFVGRKTKNVAANTEGVVIDSLDVTNLCRGINILHSRYRTRLGWSSVNRDTFNKKSVSPVGPNAGFNFIVDGSLVSFQNTSTNTIQNRWQYGDAQTSTIKNPFYTYSRPGVYKACLIAGNNSVCPNDTLCQDVGIVGIRSIETSVAGRRSTVTVTITGAGFQTGTTVKLTRNGQITQIPKQSYVESNSRIRATFDFGVPAAGIGLWTVNVRLPTGDSLLLVDGFKLVDSSTTNLWVNIVGDRIYRPGFQANYTVTYGNKGNTDAVGSFLFVRGFPKGTKIFILNDSLDISKAPGLDTLNYRIDSIPSPNEFLDSISDTHFTCVIVPLISAMSVGTLKIKIVVPIDIDIRRRYQIKASLSAPSQNSINRSILSVNDLGACLTELGGFLVGVARTELNNAAKDVSKCITGAVTAPSDIMAATLKYAQSDRTLTNKVLFAGKFALTIGSTLGSCARAAGALAPQGQMMKIGTRLIGHIANIAGSAQPITDACSPLLPQAQDFMQSGTGRSFDPNIKFGPGMSSTAHYFSSPSRVMPYTILFENDTTATLPAQIITVIDTLDKSKFDMSSFGFTYVTISDSTVTLPDAPKSFIRDIDLKTTTGYIARVTGNIDTLKGIVTWVINTVEPISRQNTINPAAGILPPNRTKPQGEGGVGFIINKKQGLPDSTVIANKGYIIFDFNPVIVTPTWKAISDDAPPISRVNTLDAVQRDTSFNVSWLGSDNVSGIKYYSIFVSRNNAAYQVWKSETNTTSAIFTGQRGITYRFYSIAVDSADNIERIKILPEATTRIEGTNGVKEYTQYENWLGQNIPNPFTNQTTIPFHLSEASRKVTLTIMTVNSQVVKTYNYGAMPIGNHSAFVDIQNLPAGVYFYRLSVDGSFLTKRMVVTK